MTDSNPDKVDMATLVAALQERNKTILNLQNRVNEDIAIIGMACRFPGGANNLDEYWRILSEGIDTITEIPKNRFNIDDYYDADPDAINKMYNRGGAFLDNIDEFDPYFFGISPREALAMDPQQRIMLEVCWEALENSCLPIDQLYGSKTGVYIGVMYHDYILRVVDSIQRPQIEAFIATGNALSTLAGRVSYTFGFQGPAVTLDTACSSSLVSTHLACESLRNRSSDMALSAGVNIILSPEGYICMARTKAFAFDSHCKTFDAKADGYVRGEGCGVLVLKRLSDAISNKDPILAIIKGSNVNQDGRSSGLTAPNGSAQEDLLKSTLLNSGIKPSQVSYIEAHGTGTPLGDPIEFNSLGNVYSEGRNIDNPLIIGSVKTNIGHTESAAGVAGIIKTVLAMQYSKIPAHLNLNDLNPNINIDRIPAKIPNTLIDWPDINGQMIAGISSFGISGTNAHIILSDARKYNQNINEVKVNDKEFSLLCLSAKSIEALKDIASEYMQYLSDKNKYSIKDICYSLQVGRSHFANRLFCVGSSTEDFVEYLKNWISYTYEKNSVVENKKISICKIAFMFSGDGCQYVGMGKDLYATNATFKKYIDECALVIDNNNYLDKNLLSILWGNDSNLLNKKEYSLPAIFALEYSLYKLWMLWGVNPHILIGYGSGEHIATIIGAGISLDDGLKLICEYASPKNNADLNNLSTAISNMKKIDPVVSVILADTTSKKTDTETTSENYLLQQSEQSEVFMKVIKMLLEMGVTTLLEISPQSTLEDLMFNFTQNAAEQKKLTLLSSMRKEKIDSEQILLTVGALYAEGIDINWNSFNKDNKYKKIPLPTYPFQKKRYWVDALESSKLYNIKTSGHPLLGHALDTLANHVNEQHYESNLTIDDQFSYLKDHLVYNLIVLPGSAYLEISLAAAKDISKKINISENVISIENLLIEHPMIFFDENPREMQCVIMPIDSDVGCRTFTLGVFSREILVDNNCNASSDGWIKHASSIINLDARNLGIINSADNLLIGDIMSKCKDQINVENHYKLWQSFGVNYGYAFVGVKKISKNSNELIAEVNLPEGVDAAGYNFHPALLDSCFQVIADMFVNDSENAFKNAYLPFEIEKSVLYNNPETFLLVYASKQESFSTNSINVNLKIFNKNNTLVMSVTGFHAVEAKREDFEENFKRHKAHDIYDLLYSLQWNEQTLPKLVDKSSSEILLFILHDHADMEYITQQFVSSNVIVKCILIENKIYGNIKKVIIDECGDDKTVFKKIIYVSSSRVDKIDNDSTHHQTFIFEEPVLIAKTLASLGFDEIRFYIITFGAQFVPNQQTNVNYDQAPILGIGRTISLEYPDMGCTNIDLDSTCINPEIYYSLILNEVRSEALEDQVAYRNNIRFVCRLKKLNDFKSYNFDNKAIVEINPKGTYIITGGLGGLGLKFAEWLLSKNAKNIVLLGRSNPDENAMQLINEWNKNGANVQNFAVDITKTDEVDILFTKISSNSQITGIIHAAGIIDNKRIEDQTSSNYIKVMAPKILGVMNLQRQIQLLNLKLDFFVSFSSTSAILGSSGQGAYAASNSFLDAFTIFQRNQGVNAISIDWGAWSEVGIAAKALKDKDNDKYLFLGVKAIDPVAGVKVLEWVLENYNKNQIIVTSIDWGRYLDNFGNAVNKAFYSDVIQNKKQEQHSEQELHEVMVFVNALKSIEVNERKRFVAEFLKKQLAEVLNFDTPDKISEDVGFMSLGMDSIMSVELKNRIQKNLMGITKRTLSNTLIFNYNTINSLSDYLVSIIFEEDKGINTNNVVDDVQNEIANLEKLSDEEIADEISKILNDSSSKDLNEQKNE